MRARNIKPGYFKNEDLAVCDPLARILFCGLWCTADRDGRLEDRPARIKAEILPYDDCDVDALLGQLQDHGFIVRYEAAGKVPGQAGKRCVQVVKFHEHQRPHPKETCYNLPPPQDNKPEPVVENREVSVNFPAVCASSLNPSSLNDESLNVESNAPGKPAKQRDPVWDAVVELTGADPATSKSHIGKVVKALKASNPPYTSEEIRRLPAVLAASNFPDMAVTLGVVEKYIGNVRAPPKRTGERPAAGGRSSNSDVFDRFAREEP